MQSLRPETLTNEELERYSYVLNYPQDWAAEVIRRSQQAWLAQPADNTDQLTLDFS
jgi:hypothetical protein